MQTKTPTSLTQLNIIKENVKAKMIKCWEQGNMAAYEKQRAILKHTEAKITNFNWEQHLAR